MGIWDVEYKENRQHFPSIGTKQKKQIKQTNEYVWEYVQTDIPGPSRTDALYIAHSIELQIPVVTDDQDMKELAISFDTEAMSTLELLRIMLDSGHIKMKAITSLCSYWRYIGDIPANLDADFARLFPT